MLHHMQDTKDVDLDSMSVQELLELQAAIHVAVRAAIRQKNELKGAPASAAPISKPKIDLEGERDRWLAERRSRK